MTRIYHHGFRNETRELVPGIDYEHVIFGRCKGIMFSKRGKNDNHVVISVLTEDDETWHTGIDSATSSYWLPDLTDVLKKAAKWLDDNCDKDPSGFGYIFK